ncbi:MAG: hypothetical protein AB2A00_25755 [Myxococcota bacterium]
MTSGGRERMAVTAGRASLATTALTTVGVLAVVAGPSLTVGEGALLLLAVALQLLWPGTFAALLASVGGALLLGATVSSGGYAAVPCALALVTHAVSRRHQAAPEGPWLPAWPLPLLAGVLGAGLILLPEVLPLREIARPRPLGDAVSGALVTAWTAVAMALLCRFPPSGGLRVGLALAALVPLVGGARVLASSTEVAHTELVERAEHARSLGLARKHAELVEDAMRAAEREGNLRALRDIYEAHTRPDDLTRRRPQTLRLAARGLEATGAHVTVVDQLLQKAIRMAREEDVPGFRAWPGEARAVGVAQRARSPLLKVLDPSAPPPDEPPDALDCFGGVWCVLHVDLPAPALSSVPRLAHVTVRKVAPAVADLRVVIRVTWRGWVGHTVLAADAVEVGQEVRLAVPVDMSRPVPGQHEIWMQLRSLDDLTPMTLGRHPGTWLFVGRLEVPGF